MMRYRPNFCCHCGEKIVRAEWPVFASGRFCDVCGNELKLTEWSRRAVAVVGVLIAIAVTSSYFRPTEHADAGKSTFASASILNDRARKQGNWNTTPEMPRQSQERENANTGTGLPAGQGPVKPATASVSTEQVFYCGAATKKGTPCSRRVKHRGERCWQHAGMPAMAQNAAAASK